MVQESLDTLQGMESAESLRLVRIEPLLRALQSDYEELGFTVDIHNTVSESVPARPQALRRLLTNLLDNARRFATTASIHVKQSGDDCIFLIGDNGPGIPEAELERVFEPFYRLEPSRNRGTGGAGLGLSIAPDIAYAHGGNLTLANKAGGGLEARLSFPLEQATLTGDTSIEVAAQPHPETTPHRAAEGMRDQNPPITEMAREHVPGRVN
jgi:signal transduction histidine kinase